jgi:ankyrin repeat protein
MASDMEVVKALLARGASPNINDMGLTAFLVAAGVGAGTRGGTGLAAAASAGGPANIALMDLLIQHGADVNAQVTGTKTYSMRISRAPSSNEGFTALHAAAQSGRTDLVRCLIDKGANTQILDGNGHKPIDLVGTNTPGRGGPAPDASATAQLAVAPPAGRGGAGGGAPSAATTAEIRALLQNAGSGK